MMRLRASMIQCLTGIFLLSAFMVRASPSPAEFSAEGFRIPQPGAVLTFPRDHANHPGYKIEWWYLTGHLSAANGDRFGYQATFFRNALEPGLEDAGLPFNNKQLHLTHMALTDASGKVFHCQQRLSREGWDAYSLTDKLEVRNGNWSLEGNADVSILQLQASVESEAQWSLKLVPEKPLLRFGEDGTSRKGPSIEARSYYLTFSRMRTTGVLTLGERELEVSGYSWMDHEIASTQLDPDYSGWDWIAIQLEDNWEVKAYLLREADGTPSPFSALIWIDPDGQTYYREREAFTWSKARYWKSPVTDTRYPNAPSIRTIHPATNKPVEFQFNPVLEDQELVFPGTTYWEGAGRILDAEGNEVGSAYLELVGYAGPIEGL